LVELVPVRNAKEARESYINWGKYMKAIYDQKVVEAREGDHSEGMDLMGSLVRSTMTDQSGTAKDSQGSAEKGQIGQLTLSQADILGNAFVLIIAGHETTANSVHFALMMLAMAPGSQRRLQKEVESIFGNTLPEDWNYDSCINKCLGGMIGAVLNEELRLMPPIISIPKSVRKDQDQTIVIEGKKHVLPKGAFVNLNSVCVHRNPKYWPSRGPSKLSGRPNDLDDFIPERWLVNDGTRSGVDTPDQSDSGGEEDFGGFTGESSAAELFRPTRGSFIPFSDGPRSCLGRRLAQVEVVAVLSVIFQKYSIELAVDRWATDEEVEKMDMKERIELYKKARQRAEETIKTASSRITLKLHDGETFIPVRVVRKGEERFLNLFE
jgi:cytochrome P450